MAWQIRVTCFKFIIKNRVRISGSQFAICDSVLVISDWPFALFLKTAKGYELVQTNSAV